MKQYWKYRMWWGMGMAMLFVAGVILIGFVVMWLWNGLMPDIFHLGKITYWQAVGLLVLSKIFFKGGWHGKGRCGGGYHWKQDFKQRLSHMTPEQKEKFYNRCMSWRWEKDENTEK